MVTPCTYQREFCLKTSENRFQEPATPHKTRTLRLAHRNKIKRESSRDSVTKQSRFWIETIENRIPLLFHRQAIRVILSLFWGFFVLRGWYLHSWMVGCKYREITSSVALEAGNEKLLKFSKGRFKTKCKICPCAERFWGFPRREVATMVLPRWWLCSWTFRLDRKYSLLRWVYWFFCNTMDYYQDQQGCTAIWPDAEHQVCRFCFMKFCVLCMELVGCCCRLCLSGGRSFISY